MINFQFNYSNIFTKVADPTCATILLGTIQFVTLCRSSVHSFKLVNVHNGQILATKVAQIVTWYKLGLLP